MSDRVIRVKVSAEVYGLLAVLAKSDFGGGTVESVVSQLIDHAQQGVYRPGAWERAWVEQVFGTDWQQYLEPGDPWSRENSPMFRRPRKSGV